MPTKRYAGSPSAVALILALLLAGLALLLRLPSLAGAAEPPGVVHDYPEAPANFERTGLIAKALPHAGFIEPSAALAGADQVLPNLSAATSRRDVFLLEVTDQHARATGTGLIARPVWLVEYGGLEIGFPGPGPGDVGHVAHVAYVLVDATSGEAIDIQFWE